MALLPTLQRTWQVTANGTIAALGSGATDHQRLWRTIFAAWLAAPLGAPTCLGSSDHTTAALDNTNRLTSDGAVFSASAGSAHSWIVIKGASGMGTNVQFCFDFIGSNAGSQAWWMSPSAGFTGGTTTNRPTATDEIQVLGSAGAAGAIANVNTDIVRRYNLWISTDGAAFRLVIYQSGTMDGYAFIEKAANPVVGWSVPVVVKASVASTFEASFQYTNLWATTAGFLSRGPSGSMSFGLSTEAIGSSALGQQQTAVNGIDGGYVITPIGLYTTTSGMIGKHGQLVDLWFGSTTPNSGDTYPSDATKQFIQLGDLVHPWDGASDILFT